MKRLCCALALLFAARAHGAGLPDAAVLEVLQLHGPGSAELAALASTTESSETGPRVGRVAGATEALRVGVDRSERFHPLATSEQAARHAAPAWPACTAGEETSLDRGAGVVLDAHLACAAAAGRLLGVQAVMIAAVERRPYDTVIVLRRIDVAKGAIDAAVQERAPLVLSDAELRSQLTALGRRLAIAPVRLEPLDTAHPADEAAFSTVLDGPRAMELVTALAAAGVKPIFALRRGRRYALPSLSCDPPDAAPGHAEPVCSLPVHGRAATALLAAIRSAGADRGGLRLTDVDCDVMSEQAHCTFVPH